MIDFLIFILSSIGATLITTQSYLFRPFREWGLKINKHFGKLLKCSQCSGFYWGVVIRLIIILPERGLDISDINILLYGFISSLLSYTTYLLLRPYVDKYD
jgi:uncharacterized membrane protein